MTKLDLTLSPNPKNKFKTGKPHRVFSFFNIVVKMTIFVKKAHLFKEKTNADSILEPFFILFIGNEFLTPKKHLKPEPENFSKFYPSLNSSVAQKHILKSNLKAKELSIR